MIYGTKNYENIIGMEKLLELNPNFSWNDIKYIERLDYYIDLNDYGEEISNIKILFLIELYNKKMHEAWIKFNEINTLEIRNFGGKYNQIMGFEVIDQMELGWEQEQRYAVRDYEDGTIKFYCKSIEVISV